VVSSICASNRPTFIPQVIAQWKAQDYTDKELVIVQNADQQPALIPEGVVSVITSPGTVLGKKLNIGIAAANGNLLHKWDDDDLYQPGFLTRGAAALADGRADFCTWTRHLIQFQNEIRIVYWFGVGGSSIFTRKLTERCKYREIGHAVDSALARDIVRAGFLVAGVYDEPTLFTYVRHNQNMWQKRRNGESVDDFLRNRSTPWKG
jgi:glycosyltransferase involved in cell wall biosynthesis